MILGIDGARGSMLRVNNHQVVANDPFSSRFYKPLKFSLLFPNPKSQHALVQHLRPVSLLDSMIYRQRRAHL